MLQYTLESTLHAFRLNSVGLSSVCSIVKASFELAEDRDFGRVLMDQSEILGLPEGNASLLVRCHRVSRRLGLICRLFRG